ncbi:MAG TPA: hypothetical protein VNW52_02290 [Burkholderiaceae bacterium]|jgi:hypothetical protein|nr:hypothetical protein [Burkholderiaceae bacterium]
MTDFSFSERPRPWFAPVLFIVICLMPFVWYLWYQGSHYDLPKLKPYAGAQEDLFNQIKCLTTLTEKGSTAANDPGCRFRTTYGGFWLTPASIDKCLTYSTDTATTAFESPKRMEFDFMCESRAMRANFSYQDGKYKLEQIGMTFP